MGHKKLNKIKNKLFCLPYIMCVDKYFNNE